MAESKIELEKNRIKNIAFYLPQFYTFPENDKWWGNGFTEWTNVQKAKPLFKNHYQPTIPLNGYYSLNDNSTMRWQIDLAKKYGIDGFCFYHYWFGNDRQLMEKPVNRFLDDKSLDFSFCLSWANHNWTRTWVGDNKEILMDMQYGDEKEWQKHFDYLLPFFKDDRYIKIDGKPVFIIYLPNEIHCLNQMIDFFKKCAKKNGLAGILFFAQHGLSHQGELNNIDYFINYEPNWSLTTFYKQKNNRFVYFPFTINVLIYRIKGFIKKITNGKLCKVRTYNYDFLWKYCLRKQFESNKTVAGAFVHCDVTPRRQDRALIVKGNTPEKFKKYMISLYDKIRKSPNLKIVFISAWNEWGEGMYLEPDEKNEFGYLEALCDSIKETTKNEVI